MRRALLILTLLFFHVSCGKVVNREQGRNSIETSMSLLKINRQCFESPNEMADVTKEIFSFYNNLALKNPVLFFDLEIERFTQDSPLVVGIEQLEADLLELKSDIPENYTFLNSEKELAAKVKSLYIKAQRFEGQKCSFSMLKHSQKSDLRPMWELEKFCSEKASDPSCANLSIQSLSKTDKDNLYDQIITLCHAFEKKLPHCQAQLHFSSKKSEVNKLVSHYLGLFKREKLDSLYKLRAEHNKFQCQKRDDITQMNVKVSKMNWSERELQRMLDYVTKIWSSEKLKVSFTIVYEQNASTIQIYEVEGLLSYVPYSESNKIFLSKSLIQESRMRILAHEFGHVLGFPDCYVEFFEPKTEQLIYYEVKSEVKNLMCTIEDDMVVPENYQQQLLEKSCIF